MFVVNRMVAERPILKRARQLCQLVSLTGGGGRGDMDNHWFEEWVGNLDFF